MVEVPDHRLRPSASTAYLRLSYARPSVNTRPVRGGAPDVRELAIQAVDRAWALLARPNDLLSHGEASDSNKLALSFDDGPSAANTAHVLDLLEEHGARGTFFVVGSRIAGHEGLLQRASNSGHELANHTYSHTHTVRLSTEELRRELSRTQCVIRNVVGDAASPSLLVRPPFGKDRRRITKLARELGLLTIMWSIDSGDTRGFETRRVIETVVRRARAGAIVLMHDGGFRRDTTLDALGSLLPKLRASGFDLTTVSDVLGLRMRA